MGKVFDWIEKILNVLMVVCISGMVILVFGNVVLRYLFSTGITWSEEMSRFLFLWSVFLGSIIAFKDNSHLSVNSLIKRLPFRVRQILLLIGDVMILYILWMFFDGSRKLIRNSMFTVAPATGISMSVVYTIGIIGSVGMVLMLFRNIYIHLTMKEDNPPTINTSDININKHVD